MSDPVSMQLQNYASRTIGTGEARNIQLTSNGAPIETLTSTMTSHPHHGDILLKDVAFIDHIAAFDRERIPERVVHAKGAGAFGTFRVTNNSITRHCKAALFSNVGKATPLAIRFSTVAGELGSADTARDPRGFAVKFYTEEGNWDLVGNNTPIFFIRDPILFPSFIHSQKRNPATNCRDMTAVWDFWSLRPESTHQVSFLFSDRGIPDGFRHMHGYGSHTFAVVNEDGVKSFVKWHWRCAQPIRNLSPKVSGELAGTDPDYATRDLYNAIEKGDLPSWNLHYQHMTMEQAATVNFNPFDVTKVWPQGAFPLNEIGVMTLERNPKNYFAEIEQLAFAPSNLVPGVEPSPDKMLQGRLFSYADTQRHRLGQNYQQIPVNCPFAARAAESYRRGAVNQISGSGVSDAPNYFPNSFSGPQAAYPTRTKPGPVVEMNVGRHESGGEDNFSQASVFYRSVLSSEERERLTTNLAESMVGVPAEIQHRAIANFAAVDAEYGRKIHEKLSALEGRTRATVRKAAL